MVKVTVLDLSKMRLFLIILLFLSVDVNSATLNVPGTYPTIQAGLNAAINGDIVLIQAGVYTENINWPTTQGITLKSVNGSATTIIDGNSLGRVITFPTGQNYTNTTVIDGFTIQNGLVTGTFSRGGGIYAKDCSATLKNLTFQNNIIDLASSAWGGGIFSENSPNLIIDSCKFIANEIRSSTYMFGGAIYCSNNTSAQISNSIFLNTKATRTTGASPRCYGGVIYADDNCDLTITNIGIDSTIIQVNSYIYGGAIYLSANESSLNDVVIGTTATASNSGRVYGGGIFYNDGNTVSATPIWNNITISGQDILATSYIYGGALYLNNISLTINNSFFTRSVCNNSGGRVHGGGVYISDGTANLTKIYMTCNQTLVATSSYNYGAGFYIDNAIVSLSNALIAHNEASNANTLVSRTAGLGIYMGYAGTLNATNVTVTENTRVGGIASYGTGLANFGGTVNLVNSIFWNNDTGNEIDGAGTNNISYSDIRNGYAGVGNINLSPQFVTPGSDYHLLASSPCVNSATSTGAPIDDLDSNPRPVGGGYDMGAFEQQAYTNIDFCPIVILPITLAHFSSKCHENKTFLYWATSSEINNDYFSIERSVDGYNFYEIGTKTGAGNSSIINQYSFIDDTKEVNTTYYYRLKQVDFNGEYHYSHIIANNCFDADFNIYPNPNNGFLTLKFSDPNSIDKMIIFNTLGQIVDVFYITTPVQQINISKYANGLYHAHFFKQNQFIISKKIIKK